MANRPEHKFASVEHCSSCGQDHASVEFLAYPGSAVDVGVSLVPTEQWAWWGNCPVTGAPIPQQAFPQPGKTILGGSEHK